MATRPAHHLLATPPKQDRRKVTIFDCACLTDYGWASSHEYWAFIVAQKHPALSGREQEVSQVLADPDEIRQSRKDPKDYLFYRGRPPRWLCSVARREPEAGFLITAYPTDAVKAGVTVWTRSK